MENLQNANWGQWGRGIRGRQVAPSLAPALGVGPGWGPAWLLGALPGSSQWTCEDLRQEPPKVGRTLGQGQGLLLDVAICDQWFWDQEEASYPYFFLSKSSFCIQLPFQSHVYAHNSLSTSNNSLTHVSTTSNTYPSLLTHMML